MGCITAPLAQPVVQRVLGVVEASGNVETEPDEPRTPDRDKQGLIADDPVDEVAKPGCDEIAARERMKSVAHTSQSTRVLD